MNKRKGLNMEQKRNLTGWAFLLPASILIFVFCFYPIQYALTYPARVPGVVPELDFTTLKLLTFDVADEETFRCLAACKKAIRKGGLGPCAANGANEEAVRLFLEDKIGFLDIGRLVEAVVDSDSFGGDYSLADVYECDRMARAFVRAHL